MEVRAHAPFFSQPFAQLFQLPPNLPTVSIELEYKSDRSPTGGREFDKGI